MQKKHFRKFSIHKWKKSLLGDLGTEENLLNLTNGSSIKTTAHIITQGGKLKPFLLELEWSKDAWYQNFY